MGYRTDSFSDYVANSMQYKSLHELHPDTPERNKRAQEFPFPIGTLNLLTLIAFRKWLCFLPLYHAMAQTIFGAVAPKRGIPVYIMKKFDFKEMLEAVQKYRITTLTMVPPVVVVSPSYL